MPELKDIQVTVMLSIKSCHFIDYELFCQSADQSIDSLSQLQFWAVAFAERSHMITKYTKHAF